jgi:TolA-binding protein
MKISRLLPVVLLILIAGCNRHSAEEYFTKAEEANKAKRFPEALENYANVVNDFPKSELAERSQFIIATVRQNELQQYDKAIEEYKRYVGSYPNGKQAALAMFMIGYMYNNEFHNLDSARAAYQRFLATFPDNEMAMSAKFELDNLGKSPEELLREKVALVQPALPVPPTKHSKQTKKR